MHRFGGDITHCPPITTDETHLEHLRIYRQYVASISARWRFNPRRSMVLNGRSGSTTKFSATDVMGFFCLESPDLYLFMNLLSFGSSEARLAALSLVSVAINLFHLLNKNRRCRWGSKLKANWKSKNYMLSVTCVNSILQVRMCSTNGWPNSKVSLSEKNWLTYICGWVFACCLKLPVVVSWPISLRLQTLHAALGSPSVSFFP